MRCLDASDARHTGLLLDVLAEDLGVEASKICDVELVLCTVGLPCADQCVTIV